MRDPSRGGLLAVVPANFTWGNDSHLHQITLERDLVNIS